VLEPLGAVLALLWARRSRTPLAELGLVRPRSWLVALTLGVLAGFAFKLFLKSVAMPLLGAPPLNAAYQHLVGNTAAIPGMMIAVIVGAGFGEELVYRGFVFERLGKLVGRGRMATLATVVLSSAWFGLVHWPGQGVWGAVQATIVGLVCGTVYARTRSLWPLVAFHAAFDVIAVFIIYLGLETAVASWFLR
jgi:membrane protease YdiL (CAAX protease family)